MSSIKSQGIKRADIDPIIIDVSARGCACNYEPNTGAGADDTAKLQEILSSIPAATYGPQWRNSLSPGGVILRVPGPMKVSDTIRAASGLVMESYTPAGGGIIFTPATARPLFQGDTARYGRDSTWAKIGFRGMVFLSTLLDSGQQNVGIDFSNVQRWFLDECYFEGWGAAYQDGAASYYGHVSNTEHFNNLIHYDQGEGAGPTTFDGGVMWNYENDWSGAAVKPAELMKVRKAVHLSGLSLEPRTAVQDADNFVCMRLIGDASATGDAYIESQYPVAEVDMSTRYSGFNVRNMKDGARTLVKFKNFDLTAEVIEFNDQWSGPVHTSWHGGEPLNDLLPNPDMRHGGWGWILGADAVFNTGTKFMGPRGVIDVSYSTTAPLQTQVERIIPAALVGRYIGRRLFIGAVLRHTDCDEARFQVQDDPYTTYKFTTVPMIDYGNGWGLYVVTFQPSAAADLRIFTRVTPSATGTPKTECDSVHVWVNGINEIPICGDMPPLFAAAAPTDGNWLIGDRVWNEAPAAGGYSGWICTADGSPGTWKGFGTIEA